MQRIMRTEVILTLSVMFLNARKSTLWSETSASVFRSGLRSSPKIERGDVPTAPLQKLAEPMATERVTHELFKHLQESQSAPPKRPRIDLERTFSDTSAPIENSISRWTCEMLRDVGAAVPAVT